VRQTCATSGVSGISLTKLLELEEDWFFMVHDQLIDSVAGSDRQSRDASPVGQVSSARSSWYGDFASEME
ncbi:MAG: hypothetical protein AAF842_10125, partial [Planctomycetota bacterium]